MREPPRAAGGGLGPLAPLASAADAVVERLLSLGSALEELDALAREAEGLGPAPEPVRLGVYVLAARDPRFLELAPRRALEAHLRALLLLAPVTEASLWLEGPGGRPTCALRLGSRPAGRAERAAAASVLAGRPATSGARARVGAVPVRRYGQVCAALVVRARPRLLERSLAYAEEAARALPPVLERQLLLERRLQSERQLLEETEKRIARLAFDIHDGALQDLTLLLAELSSFRRQLEPLMPDERRRTVALGRIGDLEAIARTLEEELRELVLCSQPHSARTGLEQAVRREIALARRRTGLSVELAVEGDVERTTASQRIAIARVVQEALANVREHSGATEVAVSVEQTDGYLLVRVADNGRGFDVEAAKRATGGNGRLGLVGMSERVRLLGGTFQVESRPGGPTAVSAALPRWEPLVGARPRRPKSEHRG